jgi:hypothetical protein
VGGVKLPLALAELGLIDEYEFVVQPRLVGHGPTARHRSVAAQRPHDEDAQDGTVRPRFKSRAPDFSDQRFPI